MIVAIGGRLPATPARAPDCHAADRTHCGARSFAPPSPLAHHSSAERANVVRCGAKSDHIARIVMLEKHGDVGIS